MPGTDTISSVYAMYCNPSGARRLSKSFQPGKYDVLCARGKKAHDSEGNRRFRALVKLHQTKYAACTCKVEKSKIVSHIVDTVRNASPNGGFVKIIDGEYWEAGDRAAKEKVGQTFRDLLHTKYSSSTKAKARARLEKKGQQQQQQQQQQSMDMSPMMQRQTLNVNLNMMSSFPQQQMSMNHHYQQYNNNGQQNQAVMPPSSPEGSAASVISDDSFSNHTGMDDSSSYQLSPTPQRTRLYLETPPPQAAMAPFYQQQPKPLPLPLPEPTPITNTFNNGVMDVLRSSIQSIDNHPLPFSADPAGRRSVHNSLRSSGGGLRNSLLRSSIHTIDEAQQGELAWPRRSFAAANGNDACAGLRASICSLTPLPLSSLEGTVIDVGTAATALASIAHTADDTTMTTPSPTPVMSNIEHDFANNMELDDDNNNTNVDIEIQDMPSSSTGGGVAV